MFEYTKLVFNQTVNDIKKISTIANFVTQCIYILYLVYAIFAFDKVRGINIALLILSFAYLVFTVVLRVREISKADENIEKRVKKGYRIAKHIIQIPVLITAVITLISLENDHITFPILFTVLMIIGYIVSVLASIITNIVESRAKRFIVAIEADIEPVMNIINTVKKFNGEKVEEPENSKSRAKIRTELDSKIGEIRKERANLEKNQEDKVDKSALWEIRKEIVGSLVSKVVEKAKKKIKSFTTNSSNETDAPENAKKIQNDLVEK